MPQATLTLAAPNRTGVSSLTDAEFLQALRWERGAEAESKQAAKSADVAEFARRLKKRLRERKEKKPRDVDSFFPALWSLPAFDLSPRHRALVELLQGFEPEAKPRRDGKRGGKKAKQRSSGNGGAFGSAVEEWLERTAGEAVDAFQVLCLIDVLANCVDAFDAQTLWKLWRRLWEANAALLGDLDETAGCEISPDRRVLLVGELRWKAGLLFAGLAGARELREAGHKSLRESLLEGTDTDGTPDAELVPRLALWLAPLVRSSAWVRRFEVELWNAEQAARFRDLVRIAVPLCRTDGRLALSNGTAIDAVPLLSRAMRLAGWKKKSRPGGLLSSVESGLRKGGKKQSESTNGRLAELRKKPPVTQSDWAQLAVLRSDWSPASDALVVAHHGASPVLDLTARGIPFLHGDWDISVTIDGETVALAEDWECSCWHSDADGDFLELQMDLADGVRIERQVLLSRDEHWLLLADCVSTPDEKRIDYAARIPLAEGIRGTADRETRQGRLEGSGLSARVFPLALPQDRIESTSGSCDFSDGGVDIRAEARGGCFVPLLLDWSPRRNERRVDWRRLTVTENGRVVRASEASGHRIRIGNRQLVIYHSLRKSNFSRAVLGHHTTHETVVGRFDSTGEVDPILLVE